jgi:hypothetical protein
MELARDSEHTKKIVVNAPFIDEDTLGIGHKEVHVRRKSSGHHFCDNFGNSMDEANKSKIMHLLGPIFFGIKAMFAESIQ